MGKRSRQKRNKSKTKKIVVLNRPSNETWAEVSVSRSNFPKPPIKINDDWTMHQSNIDNKSEATTVLIESMQELFEQFLKRLKFDNHGLRYYKKHPSSFLVDLNELQNQVLEFDSEFDFSLLGFPSFKSFIKAHVILLSLTETPNGSKVCFSLSLSEYEDIVKSLKTHDGNDLLEKIYTTSSLHQHDDQDHSFTLNNQNHNTNTADSDETELTENSFLSEEVGETELHNYQNILDLPYYFLCDPSFGTMSYDAYRLFFDQLPDNKTILQVQEDLNSLRYLSMEEYSPIHNPDKSRILKKSFRRLDNLQGSLFKRSDKPSWIIPTKFLDHNHSIELSLNNFPAEYEKLLQLFKDQGTFKFNYLKFISRESIDFFSKISDIDLNLLKESLLKLNNKIDDSCLHLVPISFLLGTQREENKNKKLRTIIRRIDNKEFLINVLALKYNIDSINLINDYQKVLLELHKFLEADHPDH